MKLTGELVVQLLKTTRESACEVTGSSGTDASGAAKLNAAVRSPTVERRHALRLGTSAPKRRSQNSSGEVRSKTCELTKPPRLNGETTSIGIRKPSPIGPRIPCATAGSGSTVTNSPGVPGGAVGGGTWS